MNIHENCLTHPLDLLLPEVAQEIRQVRQNPNASSATHKAAIHTKKFIQKIFFSKLVDNLNSFIKTLEQSSSSMAHKYAVIQQSLIQDVTEILPAVINIFETWGKLITEQKALSLQPAIDLDQLQLQIQAIKSSVESCKELLSKIYNQIPQNHPFFQAFSELHITVLNQITTIESMLLQNCNGIQTGDYQLPFYKLDELISATSSTMGKEMELARTMKSCTIKPIEEYLNMLNILVRVLESPTPPSEDIPIMIEGLEKWRREEPDLAPYISELQEILKNTPLNKDRVHAVSQQLQHEMSCKMLRMTAQSYQLVEDTEKQTASDVLQQIADRRKCSNTRCRLESELQEYPHLIPLLQRCSRCQNAFYCSAACQRTDWPLHKSVCV